MFRNKYLDGLTEEEPTRNVKFQLIADVLAESRFPTDAFKPGYIALFFEQMLVDNSQTQDMYAFSPFLGVDRNPTGNSYFIHLADTFMKLCTSMRAKRFIWSELALVVSNTGNPLTLKTGSAWLEEHKALAPTSKAAVLNNLSKSIQP